MLCISGCPQVGTKLATPMLPFNRKHNALELSEALNIVLLFKSIHISLHPFRSIYIISTTLWLFNIAMGNDPFVDDFLIKTSIYKGFSMAMLNNQRVYFISSCILVVLGIPWES
jgi:hypothetical protein